MPPLIVIAGATATGKTMLAIELARRLDGAEIVSADSRQVYRGMDIGTAKANAAQRAAAAHHCLDLVDPDVPFNAADFRRAALAALSGIARRGHVALLAGGTGLYLRAVARGLPLGHGDRDQDLRTVLESRLEAEGLVALADELSALDPEGATAIDLRNPRRVVRALERAALTGSAVPPEPEGYPAPVAWLGLTLDPTEHRRRIRARVDEQFAAGLLAEAAGLLGRYPEDLSPFSAMGYREAFDVLAGRCDLDAAKERVANRTSAYARRQRTWFRSEPGIDWIDADGRTTEAAVHVLSSWLRDVGRADYAGRR